MRWTRRAWRCAASSTCVRARQDTFDTSTPEAMRGFIDEILGMIASGGGPGDGDFAGGGRHRDHEHHADERHGAYARDRAFACRWGAAGRPDASGADRIRAAVGGVAAGSESWWARGRRPRSAVLIGVSLRVSAGYVVLSIAVSSAVGIVSGWYPARRAAGLDPVVALRAE